MVDLVEIEVLYFSPNIEGCLAFFLFAVLSLSLFFIIACESSNTHAAQP
jgi:hypothetical protein